MANLSKSLALAAAAVLAQFTQANEVYACEDGQCFLEKNLAKLHATESKLAQPATVTREDVADLLDKENSLKKAAEKAAAKEAEKEAAEKAAAEAKAAAKEKTGKGK
jgi:topoisomerase IA-like protein